jgi:hypothetical protein
MAMLPIMRVASRKQRSQRRKPIPPVPGKHNRDRSIEIRFPNGGLISLSGSIDRKALAHLIELLVRP